MIRLLSPLALLLCLLLPVAPLRAAPALQFAGGINSPAPGESLRGTVNVTGSASHPEFWKYEVHLAPGANAAPPDDQWIRLAVREQSVQGGVLATWNTANLADGAYTLRLRVVRLDGNWQDFSNRTVTVANSAPPTATPAPPTATPLPPTATPPPPPPPPSPTFQPSPTTNFASPTPPQETATAFVPATLTPSLNQPGVPTPALSGAAPTLAAGATTTPIIIDQPEVAVLTTPPVLDSGEGGAPPSDGPVSDGDSAGPESGGGGGEMGGIVESFGEALNLGSMAGACFGGAAISAGVFLLFGLLFILRGLVRLVR